jgi:NADH-ubiquinone oxidoreductase chain 5
MVGPYGLSVSIYKTANNISNLDSGVITTYALYIVLSLISFLFIIFSSVLMGESILDPRLLIVVFILLIDIT